MIYWDFLSRNSNDGAIEMLRNMLRANPEKIIWDNLSYDGAIEMLRNMLRAKLPEKIIWDNLSGNPNPLVRFEN